MRIPTNKVLIEKEDLFSLYNKEHKTPREIGKIYGCSEVTINSRLRKFKIVFVPFSKKCQMCENNFTIKSGLSLHKRFCAKKCQDKEYYLRVRRDKELKNYNEKKCIYCDEKFTPPFRSPNVKHCSTECNKKHYRELNKETAKGYQKKYYLENSEKIIKESKNWKINNPERYKRRNKEDYLKNKEKIKRRVEEWHENHKIEENNRREKLGLPLIGQGFMKEMELLVYAHVLFKDYDILTHHRKTLGDWGMQGLELDIYIPKLKLAFEYMGKQHYDEDYFNLLTKKNRNRESFESQKYRDRCKKRICKLKGITLIKIRYDEKLSEQLTLSKLNYLTIKTNQGRL